MCLPTTSDCVTLQAWCAIVSGGSTEASKASLAQSPAGASPDEEAEEGELEPGERAAGWESGQEEAAGRHAREPAGPEGNQPS